jgi:hypothetical protein
MIQDGILRIENSNQTGLTGGNIPAGGFKDQVLTKNSNNPFDVTWADASAFSSFNSARPITRTSWPTNLNVNATDIVSFLNAVFFPPVAFQELSFSIDSSPSTDLYEYGTNPTINLYTNISQNGASYINNLNYISGSTTIQNIPSPVFGNAKNSSFNLSLQPDPLPLADGSYAITFKAEVVGDNNGTPKTYSSNTKTIRFEAPSYNGTGINLSNTQIPTVLTKRPTSLKPSSSFTLNFNSPTQQVNYYYVYPDSWGLISSIMQNGFSAMNLFNNFNTGVLLSNGSTGNYRVYKTKNLLTCSNCSYTITF